MCEVFETARRWPRPSGILQRLPAACCACVLLVSAAAGREPNHSGAVSVIGDRNHGASPPVNRTSVVLPPKPVSVAPAGTESASDSPGAPSGVHFADLQEDAPGNLPRVVQIAADDEHAAIINSAAAVAASPPTDVPAAADSAQSTTRHEPLSRLAWPDSASSIDPAQTLRDWAEGAGLLVGFGLVALWLVRQWLARKEFPGGTTTQVRSVETLNLPQRCRIHLIEVQGRQVLVAVDPAGVKSVTVLPDRFPAMLAAESDEVDSGMAQPPEADRRSAWNTLHESQIT